jgi:hypothetical protein
MTPEQQLEKLLNDLAELTRYDVNDYAPRLFDDNDSLEIVLWQDIEAILKQTFPDDEFH